MVKYIMLITYSFDSEYVAIPCETEDEAINWLNTYLKREVQTVIDESEYEPIVRDITETEKELIYEEDEVYVNSDSDIATYKVIEIGNNFYPDLFK